MSVPAYVYDFFTCDYHTETAGTAITEQIPGKDGKRLALIDGRVTAAGTAHTLSLMYAEGTGSRNTNSALAAAGQAHIITTDAPKDPAGNAAANNDVIAYQCSDGTWEFNLVSSISGNDITLQANLVKACPAGAKVNIFGVVGDNKSFKFAIAASVQNKYGEGRICAVHPYFGEPWYVHDGNATAAGSIDQLVFAYINR